MHYAKRCAVIVSLTCISLAAVSPAYAQEKKAPGSGPNPYSDCGIGAAIFQETGWAAATSNSIWDLGTTAVTSATASPETCSAKKVSAALFIRDTYDNLIEETASGKGEHLAVAMTMFGCAAETHATVAQQVRSAMVAAVAAQDYADKKPLDKAAEFYSILGTAATSASCTV